MIGTAINRKDCADIIIYAFTDPMMGLSYEHEPVLQQLRAHYGSRLHIEYVMCGLVRDVSDFMTPQERVLPAKEGIAKYNKRLADIYLDEIPVGNLPMNMENFYLFDADHRSSYPLNLAYEAAKIVKEERSELFLFALRKATILEGRQTSKTSVLTDVAESAGIDKQKFLDCYKNGKAEVLFKKDLNMARKYAIRSLPSYLVHTSKKEILINGMPDFNEFERLISQIAPGKA